MKKIIVVLMSWLLFTCNMEAQMSSWQKSGISNTEQNRYRQQSSLWNNAQSSQWQNFDKQPDLWNENRATVLEDAKIKVQQQKARLEASKNRMQGRSQKTSMWNQAQKSKSRKPSMWELAQQDKSQKSSMWDWAQSQQGWSQGIRQQTIAELLGIDQLQAQKTNQLQKQSNPWDLNSSQ
ncbi:MAG: hypothetical protein JO129_01635 [Candidatus Dependentiae bacterium]|nr:hypothetical protein [Candidatus Dependentiae bacterium]